MNISHFTSPHEVQINPRMQQDALYLVAHFVNEQGVMVPEWRVGFALSPTTAIQYYMQHGVLFSELFTTDANTLAFLRVAPPQTVTRQQVAGAHQSSLPWLYPGATSFALSLLEKIVRDNGGILPDVRPLEAEMAECTTYALSLRNNHVRNIMMTSRCVLWVDCVR